MNDIDLLTRRQPLPAGVLLDADSRKQFNALYHGLLMDHRPVGLVEGHLVGDMAVSLWRLQRFCSWTSDLPDEDNGQSDRLLRYRSGVLDELQRATVLLRALQKDRAKRPRKAPVLAFSHATVEVDREPARLRQRFRSPRPEDSPPRHQP